MRRLRCRGPISIERRGCAPPHRASGIDARMHRRARMVATPLPAFRDQLPSSGFHAAGRDGVGECAAVSSACSAEELGLICWRHRRVDAASCASPWGSHKFIAPMHLPDCTFMRVTASTFPPGIGCRHEFPNALAAARWLRRARRQTSPTPPLAGRPRRRDEAVLRRACSTSMTVDAGFEIAAAITSLSTHCHPNNFLSGVSLREGGADGMVFLTSLRGSGLSLRTNRVFTRINFNAIA